MLRSTLVVAALALALSIPASATDLGARPPHYALWLCVHLHERTAWNDPNPPYLGGLQLGTGWFIPHYSRIVAHPPGLVNTWSPLDQMWFAERAFAHEHYSVGWFNGQWPPSAGRCGL